MAICSAPGASARVRWDWSTTGLISQDLGGPGGLTIDTGTNAVLNTNVITADSTNGVTVVSSLVNNGLLIAQQGVFTLEGSP